MATDNREATVGTPQNQLTSRVRVRLPNKFVQEGDILLWLQRFELYVAQAAILEEEWRTTGRLCQRAAHAG